MCTRIWWVRPVRSVASIRLRAESPTPCSGVPPKLSSTRNSVCALCPSSLTRTIFSPAAPVYLNSGSFTCRTPCGHAPTPSAKYTFFGLSLRQASCSFTNALRFLATTNNPLVSLSSRCTNSK